MVFYFNLSQFPCSISEVPCSISEAQNHYMKIYEAIAQDMNLRNDGNTYTATPNTLTVTTELPEEDPNFDSVTYTIDTVEAVSTPAGYRIKVTLSAQPTPTNPNN